MLTATLPGVLASDTLQVAALDGAAMLAPGAQTCTPGMIRLGLILARVAAAGTGMRATRLSVPMERRIRATRTTSSIRTCRTGATMRGVLSTRNWVVLIAVVFVVR